MSEFPEMPIRSVDLPYGCKDLLDVDAIRNWKPAGERVRPWRETTDRLAYIEGQMAELFQTAGRSKLIYLSRHEDHGRVLIISDNDLNASVVAASWRNAVELEAIRSVFDEARVPSRTEPVGHWETKDALKYALPAKDSDAAGLIGQVFRAGYGLEALGVIKLLYHDRKPA
jgi:hypothetical protein